MALVQVRVSSLRKYIHCHGVAKLKSDPGMCDLTDKALTGFLAENSSGKTSIPDICTITDGKKPLNKFSSM